MAAHLRTHKSAGGREGKEGVSGIGGEFGQRGTSKGKRQNSISDAKTIYWEKKGKQNKTYGMRLRRGKGRYLVH